MASGISAFRQDIEVALSAQGGTFDVAMALYTDELYQTMVSEDFTVTVPDPIFVGITLEGDDAFVLQTHSCWATPTPDPEDTLQYTFIDDFCSTEDDETVQITQNGIRPTAQFSIAVFSFVDADGQIYLHCNVRTRKERLFCLSQ